MLPNQYNPETDPQEAARAAGTMLRTGTVVEVDTARALLRFKTGDITTDWLPWFETRAGGARGGRTWWPPVVGEQGKLRRRRELLRLHVVSCGKQHRHWGIAGANGLAGRCLSLDMRR